MTLGEQYQAKQIAGLRGFIKRLTSFDDLGHAVSNEVRQLAADVLVAIPADSLTMACSRYVGGRDRDSW